VLSDLEMLIGLAGQLEIDLPAADDVDAAVVANAAVVADFGLGDTRFSTDAAGDGAGEPHAMLSGGGTWQHDPTLAGLREPARDEASAPARPIEARV
jgi:hypothetical protein